MAIFLLCLFSSVPKDQQINIKQNLLSIGETLSDLWNE